MNLGNTDSFAKEACICLGKTISPFLNLFQRQRLFKDKEFTRETFLVSREQKLTKFVYFLETIMYASSVF